MSDTRRRIALVEARRPLVVGFVATCLVALGVVSVLGNDTAQRRLVAPSASSIGPVGAESTSFTCGGMTEAPGSVAWGSLDLSNIGHTAVSATVVVVDDAGHRGSAEVVIPAEGSTFFDPGNLVAGGTWLGAIVEAHGGGVGVVEQIHGSSGVTSTPCGSLPSPRWYFAGASTANGQHYTVNLVNPTLTPSVVNVSFLSADGASAPSGSQGLVVPPHGVTTVAVQDLVAHAANLATVVHAFQGRIVAFATQDSPDPAGTAVTIGEPTLESSWVLARSIATPGAQVAMEVANPTPHAQTVVVHVRIPSGWLSPWSEVLAPYSTWQLPMAPSTRLPQTDTFAATLDATGPGVVAFTSVQIPGARTSGWALAPLTAPAVASAGTWVLPDLPGLRREGISLTNLGVTPVTLHVEAVTKTTAKTVEGLDGLRLDPRSFVVLTRPQLRALRSGSVLITADGSIATGETFDGSPAPGIISLNGLAASQG